MPDMTSILGRAVSSVERPPELPAGEYLMQVVKYDASKKTKNGNEQIIWELNVLQPIEVDGDLSKFEFPVKLMNFMVLTEKSGFIAREFLEKTLQVDPSALNLTFLEALPLTVGKLFKATLVQEAVQRQPGEEGDPTLRTKIKGTSPADS